MKKQTKKQKISDYYDVYKCLKEGTPVKRSRAKDESISTHPVVEVPDISESEVLKECLSWLKVKRIVANRNNVGSGQIGESGFYNYGIKNAGDIVGLLPTGIHFEIETKRGRGGRLSIGQQKRMEMIEKNNGVYLVIHGVGELEYYFKEYV